MEAVKEETKPALWEELVFESEDVKKEDLPLEAFLSLFREDVPNNN